MTSTEIVAQLVEASDPANLTLLAVVWWRLDKRLKTLRDDLEVEREG